MNHRIHVGTVLASTHKGDVSRELRQHREVMRIGGDRVVLRTLQADGTYSAETSVKRARSGHVSGHRIVSHPTLNADVLSAQADLCALTGDVSLGVAT